MILSIVSSLAFVLFCVACGIMAVLFMTYLLTKPFGKCIWLFVSRLSGMARTTLILWGGLAHNPLTN